TRSLPDLVVSNVQAQPTFGIPAFYSVTYTVTNQGTGVSFPGSWKDKLFLSLDSSEGSDIELQTKDNINALAPGASYNGSFKAYVEQAGEYYLYVRTDAGNQVLETNEANNLTFRNPGRVVFQDILPSADLISGPGGITTTANAIAGGGFQFNYLVKNVGNAHAIGQASLVQCGPAQCNPIDLYWEDFAYISTDSIFGPNAIPIGRVKVNPRAARANSLPDCEVCNSYYSAGRFLEMDSSMVASSTDLVIPHNFSGKAFLFVRMNEGEGQFNERFKQNNLVRSKAFNVILRPPADLQVNSVTVTPTSTQQGNFVKVKYRIRNIGVNSPISTEMQWTDKVYLSTSSVLNKNTALVVSSKVFPLSFFGNNEQYSDSVTFQVPFLNQTPLFVFVETDAGNSVFEHTFKANNISSANQLNLDMTKKPDYVPTAFTSGNSVQAGSTISASLTISNSGNANGNGTFQTSFRLKLVGSPTAPQEILSTPVSALLISATTPVAKNITIPANTTPGQYELSVFVDADNAQPELNESNNILTRTITVTAAPAFDLGLTSISAPASVDIFQNQPSFQVGGEAFFNTLQGGPGLPNEVVVKISVSQNANGSNPLYYRQTTLSFPGGVPSTFTIPNQTINRNTVPEGNYFVLVELVSGSEFETNPANNRLSKAIFFETSPRPDLVFVSNPSTLTLVSGQSFSIPLEIKNTGVNELQGTSVTKAVLSNSPSTINLGFDFVGTSAKVPGIFNMPTNQVIKDTIRGYIPLAYSGNYFLQLVVEADNKTFEGTAGEANNVVTIPILISPPVLPDLVADPLVLPANVEAGRSLSFNYTLRNNGPGSFVGGPKNTFRLSKTGIFNPFTDGEVGFIQPSIVLNSGGSSVQSAALRANGLLPGVYKPGVFVNSTFSIPETNFLNNEQYATGTSNLFINPLNLGVQASETGFIGDYFYRSVNIGAGLDILAEFQGAGGYASRNKVPTASNAEFSGSDNLSQELIIPNSEAGQYFFGVVPNPIGPVSLKVRAIPFSIISLSPNRVGRGNATTEIKGAALTSQTIFVLRNAGGVNVDTGTIRILRNSMQARVTFHCGNLPIGFYTVRAIKPGNEFTDLVNGLQVVAKSASGLVATNTMPDEVNSSATVVVNYVFTNAGNTDVENGFGRVSFPLLTKVKNVTISSNADGYRSMLAKSGVYDLDNSLDYQILDLFALVPAWKRNMAPGESFQISLEMERFSNFSEILIGSLAQDLGNEQFQDMIATEVEKIRGLSIQKRSEIDKAEILDSLGGYWSFQRMAFKNLRNSGFFTNADLAEINQRPYYPSVYQAGTMRGYGISYDTRVMENLSLQYICEAPLSEYNLPSGGEIYTFSSNGALVTYSANYRRAAQDLIASACKGDTVEFKRRIGTLRNGKGFSGDLKNGFAYGPAIYTVIFGEYQPFQNSPGNNPGSFSIQASGGSFTGPG
ncbi:MAG TPA: CARDB domain-containing protein, partial [Catalimonadaceae bacterium]|nr:CARDB domain-containing protein [Catalimonadaceae bacterium]